MTVLHLFSEFALVMAEKDFYRNYQQCSRCKSSFEKCVPRILPCLHSVCHDCCEQLVQQETSVCPCCSENLEWTITSAEHLPVDHHRKSIIEYLKIRQDTLDDLLCEKCEKDKASFRCKECIVVLCQNCLDDHFKFIKDHTIISFNEVKTKKFLELISPLICENHNFPLQKYCYSDKKAVCNICELTDHHKEKGHIVENISTVYSDKKKELESNIVACKETLETVTKQKANIANEIAKLNATKITVADEIDVSINSLIEALGKRRQELKYDLNSVIESCSRKWNKKLEAITVVENKQKESLIFAEKFIEYLGQEDFCQTENIISDRLQNVADKGRHTYVKPSELTHITFARGDIGMLIQLNMTNNWLSLIDFSLYVADEIKQLTPEDKEVNIGQIRLTVVNGHNFYPSNCPLQIVVKQKPEENICCMLLFDESEKYFNIKSELLNAGDYSLEVRLHNRCVHQQTFKFIVECKDQTAVTGKFIIYLVSYFY